MLSMTTAEREAFAAEIRTEIDGRGAEIVYLSYEPGDGTHYDLVLVSMERAVRVHGMSERNTAKRAALRRFAFEELDALPGQENGHLIPRDRWLLADGAAGFRAMTVDLTRGHYTDPMYVHEKWQRTTLGSAIVVAELLNMICDCSLVTKMRAQYSQVFGEAAVSDAR